MFAEPTSVYLLRATVSGHVQGVGFRWIVKQTAMGFDVTGSIRNMSDGRVELFAEGERSELEAFQVAIPEAGLSRFIRLETVEWLKKTGEFKGFEIVG